MKRKGRRDAKLPEDAMAPEMINDQPPTASCQLRAALTTWQGWKHVQKN